MRSRAARSTTGWPSLEPVDRLAVRLLGDRGPAELDRWFDVQLDRTTNRAFARRFDPAEALALVDARYAALRLAESALARNVTPTDAATLAECHAAGSLFGIVAGGRTVGLIATLPDAVDWLEGEIVMEEVVAVEHARRGYAAAGQRALAARRARTDGRRLLIGTIDGANAASSRSAVRAGRPAVCRYAFVPLDRANE